MLKINAELRKELTPVIEAKIRAEKEREMEEEVAEKKKRRLADVNIEVEARRKQDLAVLAKEKATKRAEMKAEIAAEKEEERAEMVAVNYEVGEEEKRRTRKMKQMMKQKKETELVKIKQAKEETLLDDDRSTSPPPSPRPTKRIRRRVLPSPLYGHTPGIHESAPYYNSDADEAPTSTPPRPRRLPAPGARSHAIYTGINANAMANAPAMRPPNRVPALGMARLLERQAEFANRTLQRMSAMAPAVAPAPPDASAYNNASRAPDVAAASPPNATPPRAPADSPGVAPPKRKRGRPPGTTKAVMAARVEKKRARAASPRELRSGNLYEALAKPVIKSEPSRSQPQQHQQLQSQPRIKTEIRGEGEL